jgi:hypothetical protein
MINSVKSGTKIILDGVVADSSIDLMSLYHTCNEDSKTSLGELYYKINFKNNHKCRDA